MQPVRSVINTGFVAASYALTRNGWLFSIIVPSDAAVGAGYVVSDQGKERGGLIKIDFKRAT
jgi:hypothetical protein